MSRVRVETSPESVEFDEIDRIAQVLAGTGSGLGDGVLRGDPGGERARKMVSATRSGPFPETFKAMLDDMQHLEVLCPVGDAALSVLSIAAMKSQSRGRLTRKGHEWVDQVLYINSEPLTDRPHIAEIPYHMGNALTAGITLEAIEAYRDGRLDDLADDDRQYVDFILAVRDGTVTDELWRREVELMGSERAVAEQLIMIMILNTRVRMRQVSGTPGLSDGELAEIIEKFRTGELPPSNLEPYEAYYDECPWPRLPDGY